MLSNKSIERLTELQNRKDAPVELKNYVAEVRAFRVMYYYYLLDMFGRVPLVLSSSTPMKDVNQSEREDVFKFIVNELQAALPYLNEGAQQSKR